MSTTSQTGHTLLFSKQSQIIVLSLQDFPKNVGNLEALPCSSSIWIPMSRSLSFIRPTLHCYPISHCTHIINKTVMHYIIQSCISNIHLEVDVAPQRNLSIHPQHIKPTSLSATLYNSLLSGNFSVISILTPLPPEYPRS